VSRDLKLAFAGVWAVVTAVTASTVIAPLVLPASTIEAITPVCVSKRLYHRECFLCGTTTAFIAIAHGDWSGARRANRGAIPLYFAFVVNAAAALVCAWRALGRYGSWRGFVEGRPAVRANFP
jgi:Protein of unknown function (DUF2752)